MGRRDRINLAGRAYYNCADGCSHDGHDIAVFDPVELYWDEGTGGRPAGWYCELCLGEAMLRPDGRETLADAMNREGS